MTLILERKYVKKNKEYFLFITNRFLRIYPLYLFILCITLVFVLVKFLIPIGSPDNAILHYIDNYSGNPHLSPLADFINLFLRNLTLIITTDYFGVHSRAPGYLLVPQAWTLQIELLFYIIIPFIIWKNYKALTAIFCSGIILFILIKYLHLEGQFNLFLAFIHYLLYFLLGIFSFKLFKLIETKNISRQFLSLLFVVYLMYLFAYNNISLPLDFTFDTTLNFLHYIVFTGILPFIFLYTNKNKWDRLLGELSYPLYISHIFIIKIMNNLPVIKDSSLLGPIAIFFTIIFSVALIRWIEKPVEDYRQKRVIIKKEPSID